MKRNDERGSPSSNEEIFAAHGFEPTLTTSKSVELGLIIGRYLKTTGPRTIPKITLALRECAESLSERGFSRTNALLIESMLASLTDATNTHDGEGRNLAAAMQRLKLDMPRH
ncbi:hypothetical protein GmRootV118_24760 [Variovorax sp. V118]|uniref:hypothetical protein n=1 Tax=Variovorax sp. V118 TaxID=3065954 RepID=UPI0034E85C82